MNPWAGLVELIARGMTATSGGLGGSVGVGIFALTFAVRLALIPLMMPLAIHVRDRQRVVRRIRPDIKALDKKLKDHPRELSRRLKALHEEHGIKMVDWPGLAAALIQVPILIAFFQAVFLVSEQIALSPAALGWGLLAAALSVFATKSSGQSEGASWMLWLAAILPVAISLWLGSGVALYLTAFYAAGAVQALLMRRAGARDSRPGLAKG